MKKNFKSLPDKNFEHYYELANFYKDNQYYEKSIKHYSLALKDLQKDSPSIIDVDEWETNHYDTSPSWP